jgi:hypothetical protein
VLRAWQDEMEARLQKIAEGKHKLHDWRQAIDEIRLEIHKDASRDCSPTG